MHFYRPIRFILTLVLVGGLLAACTRTPAEWYTRGAAAAERGDWEEAAEAFAQADGFADAPERAVEARALIDGAEALYDAAKQDMRDKRWFDAYAALQDALAKRPNLSGAEDDLARVTAKLDDILAEARQAMEDDDPDKASELYASAGTYRDADTSAQNARALAGRLDGQYNRMESAANQKDWSTALDIYVSLMREAPNYRDLSRLQADYLRKGYAAAEELIAAQHYTEALRVLEAIIALDPTYGDAALLQEQARGKSVVELVGVHAMHRIIGEHRGLQFLLDSVEVRPDGELVIRATVTNVTSMPNHLNCLQNDEESTSLYLLTSDGRQETPVQWACQQWKVTEWDLRPGASQDFWWLYPPQEDLSASFTLVFEPWGNAEIELTPL